MMNDYLIRILAKEAGVRAIVCQTTDLVNEAIRRHQTAPTASDALSRGLTGVALIGALLKRGQRVALKFEGNGPLKKLIVESNSFGDVRGYVEEPSVNLPMVGERHDIVASLGQAGLLTVVKDLQLPELVNSVVPLETSTVDADLMGYLLYSEQIPSLVQIGNVTEQNGRSQVAGGILIQSFPPYGADEVELFVNKLQEMPPIEAMLADGKTIEGIVALIFGSDEVVLEKRPLRFRCNCSRERSEQALLSLGKEQLKLLLMEDGKAVIDCHFCHEQYLFDQADLQKLLESLA